MSLTYSLTRLITSVQTRNILTKPIYNNGGVSMNDLNKLCGGVFVKTADIVFDPTTKCENILHVRPCNKDVWNKEAVKIFTIVNDGDILKIGSSQNGMNNMWLSYKCGLCYEHRGNDKMSNSSKQHMYRTIGSNLLLGGSWEFFSWEIPKTTIKIDIIGKSIDIRTRTHQEYENRVNEMYKKISGGSSPYLNDLYLYRPKYE